MPSSLSPELLPSLLGPGVDGESPVPIEGSVVGSVGIGIDERPVIESPLPPTSLLPGTGAPEVRRMVDAKIERRPKSFMIEDIEFDTEGTGRSACLILFLITGRMIYLDHDNAISVLLIKANCQK